MYWTILSQTCWKLAVTMVTYIGKNTCMGKAPIDNFASGKASTVKLCTLINDTSIQIPEFFIAVTFQNCNHNYDGCHFYNNHKNIFNTQVRWNPLGGSSLVVGKGTYYLILFGKWSNLKQNRDVCSKLYWQRYGKPAISMVTSIFTYFVRE